MKFDPTTGAIRTWHSRTEGNNHAAPRDRILAHAMPWPFDGLDAGSELKLVPRNYIEVVPNGRSFPALCDPGAQMSAVGPTAPEIHGTRIYIQTSYLEHAVGKSVTLADSQFRANLGIDQKSHMIVMEMVKELD
ncbi:hypothetical protein QAD02_002544 [Eretmocerus hayati]|uniref:Uncharacterized protein n=1 Tax=Eretmocerus hayati TaxID=131215 RepID=A0ACC2NJD2_9HYME|nr:hypothetical protein QAD02_002544 [Eretmocerus hayati]